MLKKKTIKRSTMDIKGWYIEKKCRKCGCTRFKLSKLEYKYYCRKCNTRY